MLLSEQVLQAVSALADGVPKQAAALLAVSAQRVQVPKLEGNRSQILSLRNGFRELIPSY